VGAGYEVSASEEGMLSWGHVAERMERARNYWVSTTRPEGRPHVVPVWGVWVEGTLYFGTARGSRKARNLAANPALAVHLESGDDVVIIEGVAEEVADRGRLTAVDAAYRAKYGIGIGEAGDGAAWFALEPAVAHAWLESEFPNTATRWRFGNA
jgi:nitroimidazol reductase NimA-like FMN-containing flavoprotein (pyridoxamine 5'-phosphate oxidase superfamily)